MRYFSTFSPKGEKYKKPIKNNKLEIILNVTPSPLEEGWDGGKEKMPL